MEGNTEEEKLFVTIVMCQTSFAFHVISMRFDVRWIWNIDYGFLFPCSLVKFIKAYLKLSAWTFRVEFLSYVDTKTKQVIMYTNIIAVCSKTKQNTT